MGWATRCLRGLFGGSKSASSISGELKPRKENNLRRFGKSFPEGAVTPASTPPAGTPQWAHPVAGKEGGEQSKRAIAVAVATAAVAEAAVATAHAAAAVVRMTSSAMSTDAAGKQELAVAAVRIQAAFRGYLARRALKALRGLVKLQALVRGSMVRRQATETLQCMHALVRAQARARECRALRSQHGSAPPRSTSKTICSGMVSWERSQSCRRNWLDGRTERCMDDAKSVKTLEVDTGKPGHYSSSTRRRGDGGNNMQSSCSTLTSDLNSWSFATLPDSPSKDSTPAGQMSVRSPSFVDMGGPLGAWRLPVDMAELRETPQLFSASSRPGSSRRGALTPTMSECSRGAVPGRYSDYPNYMAKTESFRAKARSQSAPKQRPQYDKSGLIQKPSPAAQRAASLRAEFTSTAYPGSGRLDRIGMATKY